MKLILSILFSLTLFIGSSQTKTFVGVKAGGVMSTTYMGHSVLPFVTKMGWRPGFTGGVQVIHFSERFESKVNFGIQAGVNFSQKGWTQRFKGIDNHKVGINYLEFPLEAVGYFGKENKYFVTAGMFVEYAISAKSDPVPDEAVQHPDENRPKLFRVGESDFYPYDYKSDTKLNYGPRGSLGVFRELDKGVLKLEAFFTFSIRSTYDYEPIESGIPDLALNYTAGITVGYFFSFGKLDL